MKLYDAIQSTPLRRATIAAAVLALAGGVAAALVARGLAPDPTAVLSAAFLGATALAAPIVAAGFILHAIEEHHRQTAALIAIRSLMGDLPLALGRWAIDAHFGDLIVRTLAARRPSLVVECGSGSSTVIAAECLRRTGAGRIISFEHDAGFAAEARRLLAERGLGDIASVITAPITERQVDGHAAPWYAAAADTGVDGPVDVLIVDGPPRQLGREARFPAIPLLGHLLAPGATILMDDGNRRDESRIAERWAGRIGASRSFARGGKGAWILRVGAPAPGA
jgi:predicted O-methyltransferase YrrM